MKQFHLILAPVVLALTIVPAAAEKLSLQQISSYLNELKTVQAEFTQMNDDGTVSTGTIYLRRPGRARFEYDPPVDALVIAGGQQVAIFDGKSNTGPAQYPLRRTPLNLILARDVSLNQDRMVVGHTYDGTATTVVAQDPDNPEYGSIRMLFTENPVALREWVITDDVGVQTRIVLGVLAEQENLSDALFSIRSEIDARDR